MFGFGRLGPMEVILIVTFALVIFGPKKLPEIGKALGKAIREFKTHTSKLQEELDISADIDKIGKEKSGADPQQAEKSSQSKPGENNE